MPSGEKMIAAFCALFVVGPRNRAHDLVILRSYWISDGAPMSKRSMSFVADAVTMTTNRCSGSGSRLLMRTFLFPSLNVNVSIVLRVAMSMISIFSIVASTV